MRALTHSPTLPLLLYIIALCNGRKTLIVIFYFFKVTLIMFFIYIVYNINNEDNKFINKLMMA